MNWNKIEAYLFEKYCVEGEDKELCNLMEEHNKEIREEVIEEFKNALLKQKIVDKSVVRRIAEQMKGE